MEKRATTVLVSALLLACLLAPAFAEEGKGTFSSESLTYDLYYNWSSVGFSPNGAQSISAAVPFVGMNMGWLSKDGLLDFDVDGLFRVAIALLSNQGSDVHQASDSKHVEGYARLLRARGSVAAMDLGPGQLGIAFNIADIESAFAYIPSSAVHDLAMGGLGFGAGASYLWVIGNMLASHLSATYNVGVSGENGSFTFPDSYLMLEGDLWFMPLQFIGLHAYVGYEQHFFSKRNDPSAPSAYDGTGNIFSIRIGGTVALSFD